MIGFGLAVCHAVQHNATVVYLRVNSLGPHSRFGDKLLGIRIDLASQRDCHSKKVKLLATIGRVSERASCYIPGIPWPLAQDSVGTSSPGTPTIRRFFRS